MFSCWRHTIFCSIQPLPSLLLTSWLPMPHFSTDFNMHHYILYLHRFLFHDVADTLSYSFPFPLSPSSIDYFHSYKHVLSMSLYIIILVFVYMFTFWIYLPHMRESMWTLSLWAKLISVNTMPSNCIYLPSNLMSLFLMAE
jgi:hypothetical protein